MGWRKEGIKHKKNEIYLDIIEEVNLMMSNTGQILRNDVNGKIMVKAFLSGMPDIKLGLNEKLDVSCFPYQVTKDCALAKPAVMSVAGDDP